MIWTERVIEKSSVVCLLQRKKEREKCERISCFHKKKKFILADERLDRWFDVIVNEIEAILRST